MVQYNRRNHIVYCKRLIPIKYQCPVHDRKTPFKQYNIPFLTVVIAKSINTY